MSAAHNSVRRRLLLGGAAVAGLAAAGAAAGSAVMARADFGALPTGERLKRIQASPHWQDAVVSQSRADGAFCERPLTLGDHAGFSFGPQSAAFPVCTGAAHQNPFRGSA